ncbi:MAG TPA: hypothetical protein VD837_03885 [Terriglobales bacterium]|nr:hypothetical protein [Terriglobales bacterium]
MRKSAVLVVILVVTLTLVAGAQTDAAKPQAGTSKAFASRAENGAESSAGLPVKRVVLYKNGVGYFEHSGTVRGNQDLNIEFTTGQLNDVLKSLTAVDLSGGQITGVRYNSIAPLSERLKTLQIGLDEDVTSGSFLNALRGTRAEVRSGGATVTGRILSVETVKRETAKGGTVDVTQLSIVGDGGELRSFDMGPGTSVRIVDSEIRQDVGRYLSLVGSTRSKDVRRMTISAAGAGERRVFVSYISEVPVWKSTYRIVIPKAPGTPFLQGWAIVDNTVGEDWKDVQLSLVSGAPQSFIQNISQPYYARRPVMELPQSVMLTPQEHEASLETKQFDRLEIFSKLQRPPDVKFKDEEPVAPPPAAAAPRVALPQRVLISPDTSQNTVVTAAMRAQESGANGAKLGELFEYALKQKITVLKNQSALVPIVQHAIDAERVTLVTADGSGGVRTAPLRALWLRNTTGLMLDGGTFNILEEDAFAGEGVMDVLHPDERRLLSYAADTAIHVRANSGSESGMATRVRINRGMMQLTREERSTWRYEIRNADDTAREVVLEHPNRPNFKLVGDAKPEESSTNFHRFKIKVAPKKTEILDVKEVRPDVAIVYLNSITDEQVAYFTREGRLKPEVEQALRRVVGKKNEISATDRDINQRQRELTEIDKDQSRVRENMKALKGSTEEKALLQRYTRQLDSQEDRINTLRAEVSTLQGKRTALQSELDQMIQNIDVEEEIAGK